MTELHTATCQNQKTKSGATIGTLPPPTPTQSARHFRPDSRLTKPTRSPLTRPAPIPRPLLWIDGGQEEAASSRDAPPTDVSPPLHVYLTLSSALSFYCWVFFLTFLCFKPVIILYPPHPPPPKLKSRLCCQIPASVRSNMVRSTPLHDPFPMSAVGRLSLLL